MKWHCFRGASVKRALIGHGNTRHLHATVGSFERELFEFENQLSKRVAPHPFQRNQ